MLETGSMPKVLANKWSKFHSLSIAVKELLKIQDGFNDNYDDNFGNFNDNYDKND